MKSQGMTDEQIDWIAKDYAAPSRWPTLRNFARAILAANTLKGDEGERLKVDRCALPPLPEMPTRREDDGYHGCFDVPDGYRAKAMQDYARAALAHFVEYLEVMVASATQIVDGEVVVGYEIKTGALHRILGVFEGRVSIPLGLPSRAAVPHEAPETHLPVDLAVSPSEAVQRPPTETER